MLTGCWQDPAIGIVMHYIDWLPVIVTHDYTTCCLYRVDPHDEKQAYLKSVEAYY